MDFNTILLLGNYSIHLKFEMHFLTSHRTVKSFQHDYKLQTENYCQEMFILPDVLISCRQQRSLSNGTLLFYDSSRMLMTIICIIFLGDLTG